jgi:hypothetical protein
VSGTSTVDTKTEAGKVVVTVDAEAEVVMVTVDAGWVMYSLSVI